MKNKKRTRKMRWCFSSRPSPPRHFITCCSKEIIKYFKLIYPFGAIPTCSIQDLNANLNRQERISKALTKMYNDQTNVKR